MWSWTYWNTKDMGEPKAAQRVKREACWARDLMPCQLLPSPRLLSTHLGHVFNAAKKATKLQSAQYQHPEQLQRPQLPQSQRKCKRKGSRNRKCCNRSLRSDPSSGGEETPTRKTQQLTIYESGSRGKMVNHQPLPGLNRGCSTPFGDERGDKSANRLQMHPMLSQLTDSMKPRVVNEEAAQPHVQASR